MRLILAALLGALLVAPAADAQRRRAAAPVQKDWLQTTTKTPAGAYVIGNPAAKVKLVEYASYTCSHCAEFAAEAGPALKAAIRSGALSLEFRHAVRDRFDLAAALLARCGGGRGFLAASDAIFAAQRQWIVKASGFVEPAGTVSMNDALLQIANGVGLPDALGAGRMPPQRVRACLSSAEEQGRLAAMREEAWNQRRIPGTPHFLINGVAQENVFNWASLEPRLRAAMQ